MEKVTCNAIDNLLLEGDLENASAHAASCDACRETMTAWNDVGATARSLHAEWRSDTLWPRIERRLAAERRSRLSRRLWSMAAAVVLTAGIGAGTWYGIHYQRRTAFDRQILRISALDEVERAERTHIEAINNLQKVAQPKLTEPESPLMVSYKEKLLLLDEAITECQTNIDRNRQNAHLRRQLLAIYSEKQRTLQEVLREGNHGSNQ